MVERTTIPIPIASTTDAGAATTVATNNLDDHAALCAELVRLYADVAAIESALGISQVGGSWYFGHGVPSNALGRDGDLYLDQDTADVYAKENGSWL